MNRKTNEIMRRIEECAHPHWEAVKIISLDNIRDIIKEVDDSLPDSSAVKEAIDMVENLFPDSHAFSKRYVVALLQVTLEAIEKWFRDE